MSPADPFRQDVNKQASACEINRPIQVIYDGQCEICQAGISWVNLLDKQEETHCEPIDFEHLADIDPRLTPQKCMRELHVIAPSGDIYAGFDAVLYLAQKFPSTRWFAWLGRLPVIHSIGAWCYRLVARNRYQLSKCRGGACHAEQGASSSTRASWGVFWSCRYVGAIMRLPLSIASFLSAFKTRILGFCHSYRKRLDLLNGQLSIFFIGGLPCDLVPILFGEQFAMIVYRGVAIDPGSPKMRASLKRHFHTFDIKKIKSIVATHHHEEHVGNLMWLRKITGAPLHLNADTADKLRKNTPLPAIRAFMIGTPDLFEEPDYSLGDSLMCEGGRLQIFRTPGHCDDHVIFYHADDKVLIVGDAFMGTYFSTPNDEVDSLLWINTLKQILTLDIDIMIDGHGHIYSLQSDFPNWPGIVIRKDPKEEIQLRLDLLEWTKKQIELGLREGLPMDLVQATCFPWTRPFSWETILNDKMVNFLSLGHFSRTEHIRSFLRHPTRRSVFPTVYEACVYRRA